MINKTGLAQTTAATDNLSVVGPLESTDNLPVVSVNKGMLRGSNINITNKYKSLQADEGDAGDVGADGFASDEELYAEKTRKQLEHQTCMHLSSPSFLSVCTATNESPCRMTVGANEMATENAVPEHKADHESIDAAP